MMKKPDEIKKGIETCAKGYEPCSGNCTYEESHGSAPKCMIALQEDSLAYIRALEAKVSMWISVKERLPERGYKVLTVNGHGYIRIFALWKKTEREWCWIDDAGHFNHVNDITHWMEMPEPPKEE